MSCTSRGAVGDKTKQAGTGQENCYRSKQEKHSGQKCLFAQSGCDLLLKCSFVEDRQVRINIGDRSMDGAKQQLGIA